MELTLGHLGSCTTCDHLVHISTHREPIKVLFEYSRVLLMLKWPVKVSPWASLIIESLRGLLTMQVLLPLKKKQSCNVKGPKVEGFSITFLQSSSSMHKALMKWKPRPSLQELIIEHISSTTHPLQQFISNSYVCNRRWKIGVSGTGTRLNF